MTLTVSRLRRGFRASTLADNKVGQEARGKGNIGEQAGCVRREVDSGV